MELVLATQELAAPGGAQTYALTAAEHLARLGHQVTLYARKAGAMAALARERGLRVVTDAEELPDQVDGVITGVDRALAFELAGRFPRAARVFVVHGADDIHLPPPMPGVVGATVAMNDRLARLAAASTGAGEVVRLRQPIDLRRFSPRGTPSVRPQRALLLGNYHSGPGQRAAMLRDAWSEAGVEWSEAGGQAATLATAEAIAYADIVVGYGRSILEAMACGRPAYVHDHSGSEGWVTAQTYPSIEAGGFAVSALRPPPDRAVLRADLDAYRPDLGQAGQDLVRVHHDARDHAAALVALIDRLEPRSAPADPSALRALGLLAEAQLRAELAAEHSRLEAKSWFDRFQALQIEQARTHDQMRALRATRRYKLAQSLGRLLDGLRRLGR
jgi:hypothetical protein